MTADIDTGIYFRQHTGGQLVVGSVEPECDPLHFLENADELREGPTEEWTTLMYRASLRFPDLAIPRAATGLTALYDAASDFTPIYDRTALGGLYSMRGTSGNQFKNAPVVGRICAKMVLECENGRDWDSAPALIDLHRTKEVLDCGKFS